MAERPAAILCKLSPVIQSNKTLASDVLQHYCNANLRNCNAIFDFKIMVFYVFDYLVFTVS